MHFAIPVSMELRRAPFRVYGSAGYFTRGSVFTGGALEWMSPSGMVFTGVFTQSYSLKGDPVLDQMMVGRQRLDAMGSAAYPLRSVAVAYAKCRAQPQQSRRGRHESRPDRRNVGEDFRGSVTSACRVNLQTGRTRRSRSSCPSCCNTAI